jgi:hypothetical protein
MPLEKISHHLAFFSKKSKNPQKTKNSKKHLPGTYLETFWYQNVPPNKFYDMP